MKRFLLGLVAVALISVFYIGFVGATANDFTISNFQADYYLDKDSDGRSTLITVELITALFPAYDQNHGIERAIPTTYDGHSVSLNIESVKDQDGIDLTYSTYRQNDNLVLRIGKSDTYVHGSKIYQITYTQRDVTRFFADTNDDEFYWDVNGTGWSQRFNNITAELHIAPSILSAMNNQQSCYYGAAGSKDKCEINKDGEVITANQTGLGAGQNMTIAVGFTAHTFGEYQMSAAESLWLTILGIYLILAVLASIITIILLIILLILAIKKGKGASGRGIIVPEYLPPNDADVALSSVLTKKTVNWTAATYIDLAVRHNIRIIEGEKGTIFKRKLYSLELVSLKGLSANENLVIGALFGDSPAVGTKRDIDTGSSDYRLVAALSKIYRQVKKSALVDGYYEIDKNLRKTMIKITIAIAVLGIFTTIFGIICLIVAVSVTLLTKPLTLKGRELLDYLKGLEMYIKTAEQERIKVLQSPQGAEKTPIDTNDSKVLVHLYERVLPYAVLFGNEKEWSKVLGKFYEQQGTSPDWYVGNNVFNAVLFSSAMSNFSSSAKSYSSPSSSSSGGSGVGGFSGGGGGGGGGGGW